MKSGKKYLSEPPGFAVPLRFVPISDVLQSLATIAVNNHYCKPQVDDGDKLIVHEGRHPVIEKIIGMENYIPNDTYLDKHSQRMMLITGPNMAGKSTYMRQVALIALLAHIGSFVPGRKSPYWLY